MSKSILSPKTTGNSSSEFGYRGVFGGCGVVLGFGGFVVVVGLGGCDVVVGFGV